MHRVCKASRLRVVIIVLLYILSLGSLDPLGRFFLWAASIGTDILEKRSEVWAPALNAVDDCITMGLTKIPSQGVILGDHRSCCGLKGFEEGQLNMHVLTARCSFEVFRGYEKD